MKPPRTVVFVCPHGAAKSVLAAACFQQLAGRRGLDVRATAAGTDPDPEVSPLVAQRLLAEGIDVRGHRPRRVTREELAGAWRIVSLGADLGELMTPDSTVERWDDVPPVSAGFDAARDRILARVRVLVEACEGTDA